MPSVTAAGLRRGEVVLLGAAVASATAAAWYAAAAGSDMTDMAAMGMMRMGGAWSAREVTAVAAMWVVMMIAMMLPSAAPMLLTYAAMSRRQVPASVVPLWIVFAAGYLLVWSAFGLAAAGAQWRLSEAGLISGAGALRSLAGGAVLTAAGVYQFTPLKQACLGRCRSPLGFLLHDWRGGAGGAFVMGLRHGAFCAGCCAALMVVLFAVGVMNLVWMLVLTVLVAAEKVLPGGRRIADAGGVVLAAYGTWLSISAVVPALA